MQLAAYEGKDGKVDGDRGEKVNAHSCTCIQTCDISALHLRVDYLPDMPSFREIYTSQATHLVKWLPVLDMRLSFGRLQLTRIDSLDALFEAIVTEWQPLILPQLHHYISGLYPVRSVVKIASKLTELLLAPIRPVPLRAMHHSTTTFVKSVMEEASSLTVHFLVFSQAVLEGIDSALCENSAAHRSAIVPVSS